MTDPRNPFHITIKHDTQLEPIPVKVVHMTDSSTSNPQQNSGGGLLSRISAQNPAAQNNAVQNNAAQNNAAQSNAAQNQQNTPNSRFGSRFSNNNQQAQNAPPAPNPFTSNQRHWTIQPVHKTVVRFELRGMGDPFFRLLGYALNPEYGDFGKLVHALEQGGEVIEELVAHLNTAWEQVRLQGAVMVYGYNRNIWTTIMAPATAQGTASPADAQNTNNSEDFELEESPQKPSPYVMLRSLDMALTMNVLARARTQLLITNSPPVLSGQYLGRSLIIDDPRLVELVKATGYMEEGHM